MIGEDQSRDVEAMYSRNRKGEGLYEIVEFALYMHDYRKMKNQIRQFFKNEEVMSKNEGYWDHMTRRFIHLLC